MWCFQWTRLENNQFNKYLLGTLSMFPVAFLHPVAQGAPCLLAGLLGRKGGRSGSWGYSFCTFPAIPAKLAIWHMEWLWELKRVHCIWRDREQIGEQESRVTLVGGGWGKRLFASIFSWTVACAISVLGALQGTLPACLPPKGLRQWVGGGARDLESHRSAY